MFTKRGCANPLVWVSNEPAGGWLFILGLLVYLAVSSWSLGYEFACKSAPSRRRRRRGPGDVRGDDPAASRPTPSPSPAAPSSLTSSTSLLLVNNTFTSLFFLGLFTSCLSSCHLVPSSFVQSPFVPSSLVPSSSVPSSFVRSSSRLFH